MSTLLLYPQTYYKSGFRVFSLDLYNDEGKKADSVAVLSGAASTQYSPFVRPERDYSGSNRCLPEGVYKLGPLEDAGANASWGEGLGRWWVSVDAVYPVNSRSAFGIHDDANRAYSMGSAGCVCPWNSDGLARIVGWFKQQARPAELVCDLGTGWLAERRIILPGQGSAPTAVNTNDPAVAMAAKLIQSFEGFSSVAYPDPGSRDGQPWTIGYGNTLYQNGSPVKPGDRIDESDADQLFEFWVNDTFESLKSTPFWAKMSDGQQASLTSFSYNTGWQCGSVGFQTLNRAIVNQDWRGVPAALRLYVKGGDGMPLEGLVRRREAEVAMWLS